MLIPPKCHVILVGLAILATGQTSRAGSVSGFGQETPVTIKDFQVHLSDVEGYSEEWSHNVYPDGGGFISVDMGITNIAVTSDHNGAYKASYRDPDGKETKCQGELDDDEWKVGKTGYSLNFKKTFVQGDLKAYDVRVRCKKLEMDLHFENVVEPFKPGSGILRFGKDDGYYGVVFTSPRAKVTGTVKVGGKSIPVGGVGHSMHTHYNMRADKQARRWFRFKVINQKHSLILAEVESPSNYGNARNGWALVLDPNGRIVETARVNFQYDGFIKDTKSEEGYSIPRRVRIAAVDKNTHFTGVLLMKKLEKVVDFTEDMGALKRAVVRRFSKPKDYHIGCTYKFRVKSDSIDQIIQGEDKYRFFYVNP